MVKFNKIDAKLNVSYDRLFGFVDPPQPCHFDNGKMKSKLLLSQKITSFFSSFQSAFHLFLCLVKLKPLLELIPNNPILNLFLISFLILSKEKFASSF